MQNFNRNRGFMQLDVWIDAISLYVLTVKQFRNIPFEYGKTIGNSIDAVHSISRNIAEGYCRRSKNEYLLFLNYALASAGEYYSCIYSFLKADQITQQEFTQLEELHYRMENRLLKLINSIEKK